MSPDTSRDAQYIAKTDSQVLQQNNFDMSHVLAGEVNAKGKATWYLSRGVRGGRSGAYQAGDGYHVQRERDV